MKILIIGGGGREHALANAYAKSKKVDKIFVAPGNDFMEKKHSKIKTLPDIGPLDFKKIVQFAKKNKPDLVDVAQDDPLAEGLVDFLSKENIQSFGPKKDTAQIESNKKWAREFMDRYHLPIPCVHSFSDTKKAVEFLTKHPERLFFIKASGLAQGKGVIRADTREEAINAVMQMKKFGKAGTEFLIEEGMMGEEFSLFAICDGENYQILGTAQDHKRVGTGDMGLNTGGMGCIAPVSVVSNKLIKEIEKQILLPFMKGMQKDNNPYQGILYVGGMVTDDGIKIIEFNARWGDPEVEVILPGLQTDYLDLVFAVQTNTLSETKITFDTKVRISIAGCAKGYPEDYSLAKGKKIYGLEKVAEMKGIILFGAGIKKVGKHFVVNGGRIFHLVAEGNTIQDARKRAYAAMSQIHIEGNNLHYRTDIGWREVERTSNF